MKLIYPPLVAVCLGMLATVVQPPAIAQYLDAAAWTALGADCANVGCEDKTCATTGCTVTDEFCTKVGDTKCRKITKNPFARCGGKKDKYDCKEVSGDGCVVVMSGDQTADNKCPEGNCKPSGSTCGTTKYTCTSTACGS